jgi:hypothetical protein
MSKENSWRVAFVSSIINPIIFHPSLFSLEVTWENLYSLKTKSNLHIYAGKQGVNYKIEKEIFGKYWRIGDI